LEHILVQREPLLPGFFGQAIYHLRRPIKLDVHNYPFSILPGQATYIVARHSSTAVSISLAWRSHHSKLVCLDPAIKIGAVEMHTASLADNNEFTPVDEVLNRLFGSADVLGCVFD
jgi:hypothetical protein